MPRGIGAYHFMHLTCSEIRTEGKAEIYRPLRSKGVWNAENLVCICT